MQLREMLAFGVSKGSSQAVESAETQGAVESIQAHESQESLENLHLRWYSRILHVRDRIEKKVWSCESICHELLSYEAATFFPPSATMLAYILLMMQRNRERILARRLVMWPLVNVRIFIFVDGSR